MSLQYPLVGVVYYQDKPDNPAYGDVWVEDANTMYMFNGVMWEELISPDEEDLYENDDIEFTNNDNKIDKCDHNWKITQGLFKEYKDCTKCNMKWEDFIK